MNSFVLCLCVCCLQNNEAISFALYGSLQLTVILIYICTYHICRTVAVARVPVIPKITDRYIDTGVSILLFSHTYIQFIFIIDLPFLHIHTSITLQLFRPAVPILRVESSIFCAHNIQSCSNMYVRTY